MAAGHPAFEAMAQCRVGDVQQRAGACGFVDMKIDVEVTLPGHAEQRVEQCVEVVETLAVLAAGCARNPTQQATVAGHEIGELPSVIAAVTVERHQCYALQHNAIRPAIAQIGKRGPACFSLTFMTVEMSADRSDAVRLGAAEAELHATQKVVTQPVRAPIGIRGVACAGMRAAGVGCATDNMPLVEMRMRIDEQRPDMPSVQIEDTICHTAARWHDSCDDVAIEYEIDQYGAIGVARRDGRQRCGASGIAQHQATATGKVVWADVSRRNIHGERSG
jgi:hypothetical protein